jgi:hypothetical protein
MQQALSALAAIMPRSFENQSKHDGRAPQSAKRCDVGRFALRTLYRLGAAVAGGGGALGSGKGDSAGAPAAFGFFLIAFGFIPLCPRGGGPAGRSSANTGLGSVIAGPSGFRMTFTCTVAGSYRGSR